jgi:hypothetical protein
MMATLYCSPPLVKFTDGTAEIVAPGSTISEVLTYAEQLWPGLGAAVSDGARPRAGVMVFVDGQEVRDLASGQPLNDRSRVELVTIAYGG